MPPWICKIPFLKTSHCVHKVAIFAHISLLSFSTSTPKISIFDYLVNHHNFSPESAANVSSSSSFKYINKPQNADSVVNFLKENGFSENHIEAVVRKVPRILTANLVITVKPKIEVFQDLGFHSSDFVQIISTNPCLLNSSADMLRLSVLGLKNVLGSNADICKFSTKFGSRKYLMYDFSRTLLPNVEYLRSCGICSLRIASFVCGSQTVFFTKPEKFQGIVKRVGEMGVDRKCKVFLYAVQAMGSMSRENWELKLQLFRELGFSEKNITHAFAVAPRALAVSERKIKEVTQLLLSVDGLVISDIVCNPILLCYSVEKRFKPRLRVLKALQTKNLLKKKPCFSNFFRITDANFTIKYMIPYSDELGDLYVDSQGS
ncbi:Mitochondrial transcription termination factor family protein [Euphorbia peplus]|nr:Mitochondrial transcription termination factor family protein [Euphorbia peplus]